MTTILTLVEQLDLEYERFNSKIRIIGSCWIWVGSINYAGYGHFTLNKKTYRAHRLSYLKFKGKIPKGLQLDHLCRVRACVNPEHLEAVVAAENIRRGTTGYFNKVKTHCKQNHPFSEENTYLTKSGSRSCRVCHKLLERERRNNGK